MNTDLGLLLNSKGEDRSEFKLFNVPQQEANLDRQNNHLVKLRRILEDAQWKKHDVIVICDRAETFTNFYSKNSFLDMIFQAFEHNMHLMVCDYQDCYDIKFPLSAKLDYISNFDDITFIVLFSSIYGYALKRLSEVTNDMSVGAFLSKITERKCISTFPLVCKHRNYQEDNIVKSSNSIRHQKKNKIVALVPFRNAERLYRNVVNLF
ncbi:hypothetical protein H8S90_24480 [Olivibacter sp. SDN3]|uniref:hypothetical protein n=1 Tax=Olivibacter sp. SDN3 TaxID=2764720 RepID=UPI0016513BE5|nr:hypothetical protein [Olivibacter sp. SDN3]QNL49821.1 hypothetical protein H8S90_24480 [Olivibacter sp. SDN3]